MDGAAMKKPMNNSTGRLNSKERLDSGTQNLPVASGNANVGQVTVARGPGQPETEEQSTEDQNTDEQNGDHQDAIEQEAVTAEELAQLRSEKLSAIQKAIAAGAYDSDELLEKAMRKMIERIEDESDGVGL
jgi:hypothetical protein